MEDVLMEEEQARIEEKKKEARIASKDLKTKELAAATEVVDNATSKELKKFSAHDDVALITAATHVRKSKFGFKRGKFSPFFSFFRKNVKL